MLHRGLRESAVVAVRARRTAAQSRTEQAALGEAALRPNSGVGEPAWSGLAANAELRARLWELHALAEAQLSELSAPVAPPGEPDPEEPAAPVEGEGEATEDEEPPVATADGA